MMRLTRQETCINVKETEPQKIKTEENKTDSTTITPSSSPQTTPHVASSLPDPEAILSETYNPELEALDLESMICWDGVEVSEEKNRELEKKKRTVKQPNFFFLK
mgnify:CR=1 FL=1